MKRFTSMFLAVCMLALPVSGCSQSSGAEASTSAASTASGDAAEEMITLTYWDGWADAGTEPTAAAVTYALEEWEKENPDIQIVADHTTSTSGAYKTKIKTALSSGEAPDVFLMEVFFQMVSRSNSLKSVSLGLLTPPTCKVVGASW